MTRPLKPEEDAYGQEMWACYKGGGVFEIVERDDGYIDPSANGPKIYSPNMKIGFLVIDELWIL